MAVSQVNTVVRCSSIYFRSGAAEAAAVPQPRPGCPGFWAGTQGQCSFPSSLCGQSASPAGLWCCWVSRAAALTLQVLLGSLQPGALFPAQPFLGRGYRAVSLGWPLSHQAAMTQQWQGPAPCWVSFLAEPFSLKEVLSAVAQGLFIDSDKDICAGRLTSSSHSHHRISSWDYWLNRNANCETLARVLLKGFIIFKEFKNKM